MNKGIKTASVYIVFLLFQIIILTTCLFSQHEDLKFIHLTTEQGLSHGDVMATVQDSEGFIWFGTQDGLNRYDGHQFKIYRNIANDSTSLPDNIIQHLFSDSHGDLWIGTQSGAISRYDKYKDCFINYYANSNDSTTLLDNAVSAITEDKQGRLWIATFNGLNRYNRKYDNFTNFPHNPLITISEKEFDSLKTIVSSTKLIDAVERFLGQKMSYLDFINKLGCILPADTIDYYSELLQELFPSELSKNSTARQHIRVLTTDNSGYVWAGYPNGYISRFNPATSEFNHFEIIPEVNTSLNDFFITSICCDNGKVWIATRGMGVKILDTVTLEIQDFNKTEEKYINAIIKDSYGNILMGGVEYGLIIYNPGNGIVKNYMYDVYNKYGLSSNGIYTIYEDRQNNLWISCIKGDVNYAIRQNPFKILVESPSNPNGLTHNNISAIIEDSRENLWIGYFEGGVDIINICENTRKHIPPQKNPTDGLGDGTVLTIFEDSKANIWIGTYLGGLHKFNSSGKLINSYRYEQGNSNNIAGNDVRKVIEDKDNNIWIAMHGAGVDKLNPITGEITHFTLNHLSQSFNWVYTLLCDNDNNIWVGSVVGVSVIKHGNPDDIVHFRDNPDYDNEMISSLVYVIFQDSKSNIWIGSSDGLGIYNSDKQTFTSFSADDGLTNNFVTGILEDNDSNMWISTYKGLSKFSLKTGIFKNFDIHDGLITDEFHMPACFKSKSGRLFFGGRHGLNYFFPDSIKTNTYKPSVYLTDFKLLNISVPVRDESGGFYLEKHISQTKEITIAYSQNVITFEFVALNYIQPDKNQYAYMIEGFDKQWNYTGNKRDATYTNLSPGNYIFKVKASNNDGVWNEKGTSLKIVITPPWWTTKWAYTGYFLVIILLLILFRMLIQYNEKQKNALKLERVESKRIHEADVMKLRFFTNISHEFRTPLTLILAPLEKLLNEITVENLRSQVKIIYRNAYRLLRLINQVMDIRKLDAGGLTLQTTQEDLISFVEGIARSFNYEAQNRSIYFDVIAQDNDLIIWFDRDKMEKVLYNLISNAFKYTSDNGKITITLQQKLTTDHGPQSDKYAEITIKDSGMGISAEDLLHIFDRFYQTRETDSRAGTGIGLALTKELVEMHDGKITVESQLGKGTKFTVRLPANRLNNKKKQDAVNGIYANESLPKNEEMWKDTPANKEKLPLTQQNLPLLLLVEDNIDLRTYIKHELSGSYIIFEAANGKSGCKTAVEQIPDIIICDIMMPVMDGIELCEKLKSDERTCHIPIVLLTAHSAEDQVVEGLETGADDYIVKPFSMVVLRTRIKNIVDSRRLLRKQFSKLPDMAANHVTPTKLDQRFIEKALQIIEQNIGNSEFDAMKFATEIGMSRAQLYRKIKAVTGFSVNELIRNVRLKKAPDLLLSSEYNVTDTAYALGFNQKTYFTKCFTDYYGMSPSKYIAFHKTRQ